MPHGTMFRALERPGHMGKILFAAFLALAGTTVACGDDDATSPAPTPDAGADVAVPVVDAGAPVEDAGAPDDASPPPVTTVSVLAGRPLLEVGAAATKSIIQPAAIGADSAGNTYIADFMNSVVEKVTPAGALSIVAGDGTIGETKPGPATGTSLGEVSAVRVDPSGNLYIASFSNYRVLKVTPDGTLSVFAGNGIEGNPSAGMATASNLRYPSAFAFDSAGDVFIGDRVSGVVTKVTPAGMLSVVAGDADLSLPVTPGNATATGLGTVDGLAVDGTGNLFISCGEAGEIAKVTPAGQLSVIAGLGAVAIDEGGPASSSGLGTPGGMAFDAAGNLYIADSKLLIVEKIDPSGIITTFAGKGPAGGSRNPDGITPVTPGNANDTFLDDPVDVVTDGSGNLYVADFTTNAVLKIVTTTSMLSFAAGGQTGAIVPGPATDTVMYDVKGLAADANGNVFFVDDATHDLVEVNAAGTLSLVAAAGTLGEVDAIAIDAAGDLFLADSTQGTIVKLTPAGVQSVIAGSGAGTPVPGPATASPLGFIAGIAVDGAGNVYLADEVNSVIEKISAAGTLSILAGTGESGPPTPGTATSSRLGVNLVGVAADASGNVYVADQSNGVVEKIATDGTLSIVAGTGTPSGGGVPKAGPATSVQITPLALAIDARGDLYISVFAGSRSLAGVVVKVTTDGNLNVFAGDGTNVTPTSGVATTVSLGVPIDIAVAPNGTVYTIDAASTYEYYVLAATTH